MAIHSDVCCRIGVQITNAAEGQKKEVALWVEQSAEDVAFVQNIGDQAVIAME